MTKNTKKQKQQKSAYKEQEIIKQINAKDN